MAASFIQFCATCETQITTPNNALLYCSTRCRNTDSLKPISLSLHDLSAFTYSKLALPYPVVSSSLRPAIIMASSPPPSPPSSKAPTVIVSPPTAATTPVGVKQKQPPADDTAASTPPDDDPIPIHRAKRAIESTAAYNFLRQFRRHVSPSGHHPTSAPPPQADQNSTSKTNSSSPSDVLSNSSSPTLTASSADGNHPSSHRDDASSLPSLSSSPETVSGTPEMNPCAVSVAKLKNGANNDINSPRFHV